MLFFSPACPGGAVAQLDQKKKIPDNSRFKSEPLCKARWIHISVIRCEHKKLLFDGFVQKIHWTRYPAFWGNVEKFSSTIELHKLQIKFMVEFRWALSATERKYLFFPLSVEGGISLKNKISSVTQ